jgi:hypothetical protein
MEVDGSGVTLMCWITLTGKEILSLLQTVATVEACHETQVKNWETTLASFSHPSLHILRPAFLAILLS